MPEQLQNHLTFDLKISTSKLSKSDLWNKQDSINNLFASYNKEVQQQTSNNNSKEMINKQTNKHSQRMDHSKIIKDGHMQQFLTHAIPVLRKQS